MINIEQKVIRPRLGVLELTKQLGNVSQAYKKWAIRVSFSYSNAESSDSVTHLTHAA